LSRGVFSTSGGIHAEARETQPPPPVRQSVSSLSQWPGWSDRRPRGDRCRLRRPEPGEQDGHCDQPSRQLRRPTSNHTRPRGLAGGGPSTRPPLPPRRRRLRTPLPRHDWYRRVASPRGRAPRQSPASPLPFFRRNLAASHDAKEGNRRQNTASPVFRRVGPDSDPISPHAAGGRRKSALLGGYQSLTGLVRPLLSRALPSCGTTRLPWGR
jgi:hypothetical protein